MSLSSKILLGILFIILVGAGGWLFFGYLKKASQPGPPLSSGSSSKPSPQKSIVQDPNGPYYHQVYAATSQDGLTWTKQDKLLFEHASVPGATIRDGVIYLYFVDMAENEPQLSVGISQDLGQSFNKKKVEIAGIESAQAVDPHPELTDNGEIRLFYFYSNINQGDPAKAKSNHQFYSATSTDGVNFINPQLAYETTDLITDPDVFKTNKNWRMFISRGKEMDLLTSADGLKFTKQEGFSWNQGAVSDTFNFNGTFRTYFCGQGIQSATGADQGNLTAEDGARILEDNKIVCDPSVIQLPDNSYLMFYKTQEITQNQPGQKPPPGPGENQPG